MDGLSRLCFRRRPGGGGCYRWPTLSRRAREARDGQIGFALCELAPRMSWRAFRSSPRGPCARREFGNSSMILSTMGSTSPCRSTSTVTVATWLTLSMALFPLLSLTSALLWLRLTARPGLQRPAAMSVAPLFRTWVPCTCRLEPPPGLARMTEAAAPGVGLRTWTVMTTFVELLSPPSPHHLAIRLRRLRAKEPLRHLHRLGTLVCRAGKMHEAAV